ncbi:MAG: dephospho-CoA kinase [Candidatus Electrothrix sp. AUS1_2]|nr:dephospho-CoA kinase [Candidatus Electrothrix sp. AUS1_2]
MQRNYLSGQQIIGITGGIGSGKSRVASFLSEEYNLPLINLDQVCRDLLQPRKAGWQALRHLLPDQYFKENGEVDRPYFRRQLFADTSLREQVDAALHPLARQEMEQRIRDVTGNIVPIAQDAVGANPCVRPGIQDTDRPGRHRGLPLRNEFPVLVEIPLLFEAGWQDDVDVILVVYAEEDVRMQRVMERDQVTAEQARQVIAAQQCLREKAASADYVIDNSGSWEYTCSQIQQIETKASALLR